MRMLLSRNGQWNGIVRKFLANFIAECCDCKAALSPPDRRVSLSSLDLVLNDIVCVDHFRLENVTLLHVMDMATRFSAAHFVTSTAINSAIYPFKHVWISQPWPPDAVHVDRAFHNEKLKISVVRYNTQIRLVATRRHRKDMIEPWHGVIC